MRRILLHFNSKLSTTRQQRPNAIVLNRHPVEEENQFAYLGSEIYKDGGSDADVVCRVGKAKGAFGILSPIWRNSSFPNRLKVRIFNRNLVSVLLYGSSTWKASSLCEPLPQKHFSHLLVQYI